MESRDRHKKILLDFFLSLCVYDDYNSSMQKCICVNGAFFAGIGGCDIFRFSIYAHPVYLVRFGKCNAFVSVVNSQVFAMAFLLLRSLVYTNRKAAQPNGIYFNDIRWYFVESHSTMPTQRNDIG